MNYHSINRFTFNHTSPFFQDHGVFFQDINSDINISDLLSIKILYI